MLCLSADEGAPRELTCVEDPRAWLAIRELYVDGRGVVLLAMMEVRVLGMLGVTRAFGLGEDFSVGIDFSDIGGDGGVGVSDMPEEDAVFGGGVSKDGEESFVVVGDSSDLGDVCVRSITNGFMPRPINASVFRSFSFVMSFSIFRSENSSFSLCASMRSDSRSCSAAFISSSSITPLSIVWLYLDSRSSKDDSVFLCFRSKSSLATSISRSRCCRDLFWSRRSVISFCRAFWAAPASFFA